MVEQGLKAVVYPELDDYGMSEFIKEFQKQMSGYVSVGVNIPDNATNVQPTETQSPTNPEQTVNPPSPIPEQESISREVKKGVNESEVGKKIQEDARKENNEHNYKQELKESIGAILGKIADATGISKIQQSETGQKIGEIIGKAGAIGSAIGVGAVSVAEYVGKIFNFLMNASPALRQVFDIIGQLVQLIWMPIGTILAVELMPMIADIAQDIGEWMGEAWEIYDKEGWAGLISKAVEMTFTVLADMLGFILPPIFTALGNMIWDGLNNAWSDFTNWLGQAFTDFVGWLWEGFTNTTIGIAIVAIADAVTVLGGIISDGLTDAYENITTWFGDAFKGVSEWLWESLMQTPIGVAIVAIADTIMALYNYIAEPLEEVGDFFSDVGNVFNGGYVGTNPISTAITSISNYFGGFFAEGGIVTQPTLGVFGEAGPEAIIPLNQIEDVARQYTSSTINNSRMESLNNDYKIDTQNITGGNTMNFYITGNNATEIGGEVQRILEKTVGKASSKMMWW